MSESASAAALGDAVMAEDAAEAEPEAEAEAGAGEDVADWPVDSMLTAGIAATAPPDSCWR